MLGQLGLPRKRPHTAFHRAAEVPPPLVDTLSVLCPGCSKEERRVTPVVLAQKFARPSVCRHLTSLKVDLQSISLPTPLLATLKVFSPAMRSPPVGDLVSILPKNLPARRARKRLRHNLRLYAPPVVEVVAVGQLLVFRGEHEVAGGTTELADDMRVFVVALQVALCEVGAVAVVDGAAESAHFVVYLGTVVDDFAVLREHVSTELALVFARGCGRAGWGRGRRGGRARRRIGSERW